MLNISAYNAELAYEETLWKVKINGIQESSARGPVITVPFPTTLSITNPRDRVIFDPTRNCNPFFHVMEFIWMMHGGASAQWITQFNSNLKKSTEADGRIHGAYGYRWRYHFDSDQILDVIQLLRREPHSRRAVISMWDPDEDLGTNHNDYPCNTHLYFRIVSGCLDMLVCNRSNDLFWGMLGANVVHMTMLQEVIADFVGIPIGTYRVVTNNLHVYTDMPGFKDIWGFDPKLGSIGEGQRIIKTVKDDTPADDYESFVSDCDLFVNGDFESITNRWLIGTAMPMHDAYLSRDWEFRRQVASTIQSPDWRKSCQEWLERKASYATSTAPSPSTTTERT